MSNSDQIEYWNGKAGERWRDDAEALDALLEPYLEAVLSALPRDLSGHILDVGCGGGSLSLAAQARSSDIKVTGVDVSKPLLSLARERAHGSSALEFIQADAATFSSATKFDALISRFGVMFFTDPVAAFSNLRAQIIPDAPMSFACWRAARENDWIMTPLAAAHSFLQDELPMPPARAPGPFAFAEADYVTHILDSAGWNSVWVEPWDGTLTMPGETLSDTAEFSLTIGPLARLIAEQDIDRGELKEALIALLSEQIGSSGKIELGAAAWIVTAKA
ncbi:MAG: class I SAM-dependent methyltransferase [Pseudomonadota bacterium]